MFVYSMSWGTDACFLPFEEFIVSEANKYTSNYSETSVSPQITWDRAVHQQRVIKVTPWISHHLCPFSVLLSDPPL